MSDEDGMDYETAQRELREAVNELRRLDGKPPLPERNAEPPYCSFCGKGRNEVKVMVQGPSVYICGDCVSVSQGLIDETPDRDE